LAVKTNLGKFIHQYFCLLRTQDSNFV